MKSVLMELARIEYVTYMHISLGAHKTLWLDIWIMHVEVNCHKHRFFFCQILTKLASRFKNCDRWTSIHDCTNLISSRNMLQSPVRTFKVRHIEKERNSGRHCNGDEPKEREKEDRMDWVKNNATEVFRESI